MKKIQIILVALVLFSSAFAQTICTNDTIISIANAPSSGLFRSISYEDNIYIFGSQISKYSTTSDSWNSLLTMPTVRSDFGAAEVNGVVYCIGGYTGTWSNKNEAYDISTNTWSTKANLPVAIAGCYAVTINNKVYVIGGTNGNTVTYFYEYNPLTNNYTALNVPTQNRMHTNLIAYNNKIYLIGGYYYNGNYNTTNLLDEYDPSTNTWTSKATLPSNLFNSGVTIYDNKLYVFGGSTTSPTWTPSNVIYVYDFILNTWTTINNMPFSRVGLSAETVNNIVYLMGGKINATTTTDLCYKYFCLDYVCHQTVYDTIHITVTDTLIINANLTSYNPVTFANTIKVFPNPTNDHITIDFGSNYSTMTGYTLKITNSLSQTVYTTSINTQQTNVDLSTWTGNGIYFVHLIDAQSNTIDIKKIVIQ